MRSECPDGPFDLILCRNLVLTYFDEELQLEVMKRVAAVLQPGGALVVGSHESLPPHELGLELFYSREGGFEGTGAGVFYDYNFTAGTNLNPYIGATYAPLLEGDPGDQTVVLEFESKEKALEIYRSGAYQDVVGTRLGATSKHFAVVVDKFG